MDLLGIVWIKQCHKLINHPLGTVAYTTCKHGDDWWIMALSYPHAHDEISQHLCNHLNPNPFCHLKPHFLLHNFKLPRLVEEEKTAKHDQTSARNHGLVREFTYIWDHTMKMFCNRWEGLFQQHLRSGC